MSNYTIKLFSYRDNIESKMASIKGNAYFVKSGESTSSKIFVFGLKPNDNYIIFYIIENPDKKQSAVEMGISNVNSQGKFIFEKDFSNKILDGYCYQEKIVPAVILVEKNDRNIESPVIGSMEEEFEYKPYVEKYIQALECNHNNILEEYSENEEYDNIIDNLPETKVFEKRDKVDKAVEIDNENQLRLSNINPDINMPAGHENLLLVRMDAGNAILYLLGLPDSYASENRTDHVNNHFNTFLSNSSKETPDNYSNGYWCKYI